ncbi:MAG: hypothetical protein ABSF09_04255 [Candidatus Bathyarchaeia archaeon]
MPDIQFGKQVRELIEKTPKVINRDECEYPTESYPFPIRTFTPPLTDPPVRNVGPQRKFTLFQVEFATKPDAVAFANEIHTIAQKPPVLYISQMKNGHFLVIFDP